MEQNRQCSIRRYSIVLLDCFFRPGKHDETFLVRERNLSMFLDRRRNGKFHSQEIEDFFGVFT